MKHSFLTRLTCLWLAFTVLLGSSGFTVVEHVCQMRGKVIKIQLTPKRCTKYCPAPKPAHSTKQPDVHKLPCCQITAHYQHLETGQVATAQAVDFPQPVAEADLLAATFSLLAGLLPQATEQLLPFDSDAPLNTSGRDRLVQFCTWLI